MNIPFFDEKKFLNSTLISAESEKKILEQSIEKNIAVSSAYARRIADITLEMKEHKEYLEQVLELYGEGRVSATVEEHINFLYNRREGIINTRKKATEELEIAYKLLEDTENAINEIKFFIHNHQLSQDVSELPEKAKEEFDDKAGEKPE